MSCGLTAFRSHAACVKLWLQRPSFVCITTEPCLDSASLHVSLLAFKAMQQEHHTRTHTHTQLLLQETLHVLTWPSKAASDCCSSMS